jgi:hypothetical protein
MIRYAGVVDGGIRLVWYPKERRLKKTELILTNFLTYIEII